MIELVRVRCMIIDVYSVLHGDSLQVLPGQTRRACRGYPCLPGGRREVRHEHTSKTHALNTTSSKNYVKLITTGICTCTCMYERQIMSL